MKDFETERARQERDSVTAVLAAAAAGLVLLSVILPYRGRVVLVLVVAVLAVVALARRTRSGS